jgi:hypothetical protein
MENSGRFFSTVKNDPIPERGILCLDQAGIHYIRLRRSWAGPIGSAILLCAWLYIAVLAGTPGNLLPPWVNLSIVLVGIPLLVGKRFMNQKAFASERTFLQKMSTESGRLPKELTGFSRNIQWPEVEKIETRPNSIVRVRISTKTGQVLKYRVLVDHESSSFRYSNGTEVADTFQAAARALKESAS